MRLPEVVPAEAVNRIVCGGCRESYPREEAAVSEARLERRPQLPAPKRTEPTTGTDGRLAALAAGLATFGGGIRDRLAATTGLSLPELPEIPRSRVWAWASVPLALLGVIAGLSLIQGSDPTPPPAGAEASGGGPVASAKHISKPGYSLALPEGWRKTNPPAGAVFAAETREGDADATLWIEEAPELSFKQFEKRSLAQLGDLADNARVIDRVEGPTLESTITELQADPAAAGGGSDSYRVTLRAAGPFRLYLATLATASADPATHGEIELLHGSLRPDVSQDGVGSDG